MKFLPLCALLAAALLPPLHASAAGSRTATFQVGMTIVESCIVDSKAAQPSVNCAFNSPSQVQASAAPVLAPATAAVTAPAAAPSKPAQQGSVWTVTF